MTDLLRARLPERQCRVVGPYLPEGEVDWRCRMHSTPVVLRDPSRYGSSDLRREDFRCPEESLAADIETE